MSQCSVPKVEHYAARVGRYNISEIMCDIFMVLLLMEVDSMSISQRKIDMADSFVSSYKNIDSISLEFFRDATNVPHIHIVNYPYFCTFWVFKYQNFRSRCKGCVIVIKAPFSNNLAKRYLCMLKR